MITFCPLNEALHLDRASFDCGDQSINEFLRNRAVLWQMGNICKTTLMINNGVQIIGYYSLIAGMIQSPKDKLPDDFISDILAKSNSPVPVILIGKFGVDLSFQGRNLSYELLGNAYARMAEFYKSLGFCAVRVDTKTERAKNFWLKHGYIPLRGKSNSLFLPIETVIPSKTMSYAEARTF
jgi:hypothetical protein